MEVEETLWYQSAEIQDTSWNQSAGFQDKTVLNHGDNIVSDSQRQIITTINYVILCGVISLFGSVANVINMIIFYRQGLNTTINISFFSLAVSDLCNLLVQQLFNFFMNPLCEDLDLPMVYTNVQYLTSGVPREAFARITCLITVYITAERCLCIAFPLHIKQMITPMRTTTVICLLFSLTFLSAAPLYATSYIDWKHYDHINRTLLGLVYIGDYDTAETTIYFMHGIIAILSFFAVVILTTILIRKLGEKSSWRETASSQQDKSEAISQRDRKTMSMVVLIASILIICYTPAVLLSVATFLEPELSVGGRYYNIFYCSWSVAHLFETINSSVNIFLYSIMSTKYRRSFYELFSKCRHSSKYISS